MGVDIWLSARRILPIPFRQCPVINEPSGPSSTSEIDPLSHGEVERDFVGETVHPVYCLLSVQENISQ